MQMKLNILTLIRNDEPHDAIQRIQRHIRGLDPLNLLNALTKRKCQWAESAEWSECAD